MTTTHLHRDSTPALDLDPGQLTLVVVVNRSSVKRLPRFLVNAADDEVLRRTTITVIYPRPLSARVHECVEGFCQVRTVESASGSKDDVARAFAEDLPYVATRFVTAYQLRDLSSTRSVFASAQRAHEALVEQGLDARVPLLLHTRQTPRQVVAGYVDFARAAHDADGPPRQDYLGSLALSAAEPRLEAADPRDGAVEVRIWLNTALSTADLPAPWRFRVLLVDSAGATVQSEPVALSERADVLGGSRWEDLVARVPLAGTSSGDHRLAIELDTDLDGLRQRRWVGPRKGALLSARTVLMRPTAPASVPVRYLIHTIGPARLTYVTVQHGDGWGARAAWQARLLKKDLAFIVRTEQDRRTRMLRLLRLVTLPLFVGRQVWVVGERYDTAQDNGFHLFRYLRTRTTQRSVYYVIDRDSPQRHRVEHLGHVIEHSSLRHRLLMLHASVVANAYSMHYLIPRQWQADAYARHLAWRVGALRLYLKHGVHLSPNAVKRGLAGYDLVITVTPRETEALRAVSGYQEQLVETGLPRYDALEPAPSTRTILFMSTWRRYLVPKVFGGAHDGQVPFDGSDYQQFMQDFLASPRLQSMLSAHDYRLVMLPHYNLAQHFTSMPLAGDRITLADTDQDAFQDQIRGCDAFITDHSSVHFDIAYLGTPIIYARFDQHDFETRHAAPGWFDYEREGFGPVTRTLTETLDALERLLERGCTQDPVYAARIAEAFTFRDHDNSRRVVAAVEERLSAQRRGRPPSASVGPVTS